MKQSPLVGYMSGMLVLLLASTAAAQPRVRKNYTTLSAQERDTLIDAFKELKKKTGAGGYDHFVQKHLNAFTQGPMFFGGNYAHMGPAFLAWHRQYTLELEDALRAVDPVFANVTIPYWDWTKDPFPATLKAPGEAVAKDFLGGNGDAADDSKVKTGRFAHPAWVITVDPVRGPELRRLFQPLAQLPMQAHVNAALPVGNFDVTPFNRDSDITMSFRNILEGWRGPGLHNRVHVWVGNTGAARGNMNSAGSPNDPVFWFHHANIDRLWCKWQEMHPDIEHHLPIDALPPGDMRLGQTAFAHLPDLAANATPFKVINMRSLGYRYDDCEGPPVGLCCVFDIDLGFVGHVDGLTKSQCLILSEFFGLEMEWFEGKSAADDCNTNCVLDTDDIIGGASADCNANSVPDECEQDCNTNGTIDACEPPPPTDCNTNGAVDACEPDCNTNGIPDACDDVIQDCNTNVIDDACENDDCNTNGQLDVCDIADGGSLDCNQDELPDECQDCNDNGKADECDVLGGTSTDCNANNILDECELAEGTALDCNTNELSDECEAIVGLASDCDIDGVPDVCEFAFQDAEDCNTNGIPDECDGDCNTNGFADACDIAVGTSEDCDGDGVPSDCHPHFAVEDCNTNGLHDECEAGVTSSDCDGNFAPDECDVLASDCNTNGLPDGCDVLDGTTTDCDGNGVPAECEICGDLNDDDNVDGGDFAIFVSAFGRTVGEAEYNVVADLDFDSTVTFVDYQAWLCCYREFAGDGPPPLPGNAGDMNLDGHVDGDDVQRFIEVLADPDEASFVERVLADFNQDGLMDGQDVAAFVDRLVN